MKEYMKMGKLISMVYCILQMEANMKESLRIIKSVDLGNILGKMEKYTLVNGKIIK